MTNGDFEDEDYKRKQCEVETARARNRMLLKIAKEEAQQLLEEQKGRLHKATNPKKVLFDCSDMKRAPIPDPYDFAAFSPWSMMTIKGLTMEAFCKECKHRVPGRSVCARGMCGTLERLEGRLWGIDE